MSVYLDMVQQYLSQHPEAQAPASSTQRKRPMPRPRPRRPAAEQPAAQRSAIPAQQEQQQERTEQRQEGQQQEQGQQQDEAMSDCGSEFVYDVYAPVEEGEVMEDDAGDLFADDTGCPVVQVGMCCGRVLRRLCCWCPCPC
jgi:hypothetical protein